MALRDLVLIDMPNPAINGMRIILFAIIMNERENLLLQDNDDW